MQDNKMGSRILGSNAADTQDPLCKVLTGLWCLWAAYLVFWVTSCTVNFMGNRIDVDVWYWRIESITAVIAAISMFTLCALVWAFAGAALVRVLAWLRYKVLGVEPAVRGMKQKYRKAELVMLVICGIGAIAVFIDSMTYTCGLAGMTANGNTELEVLLGLFAGSVYFVVIVCIGVIYIAALFFVVPMTRLTCRWLEYAWAGYRNDC